MNLLPRSLCITEMLEGCHWSSQLKEKVLLRQQGSYILTVEGGKQLLLCADGEAEAALQTELSEIQERWKLASFRLEEQKKQLVFLLKVSLQNADPRIMLFCYASVGN